MQYAAPAHPAQIDCTLAPVLEWITARLGEEVSLDRAAAHAGVSPRTLTRRFTEQLGTSPGQWLLTQRIATARDLLETSDLPLDAIARRLPQSLPRDTAMTRVFPLWPMASRSWRSVSRARAD